MGCWLADGGHTVGGPILELTHSRGPLASSEHGQTPSLPSVAGGQPLYPDGGFLCQWRRCAFGGSSRKAT